MSDYGVTTDPDAWDEGQPRLFGPEGYTAEARAVLSDHVHPGTGDLADFDGVSVAVARRAWEAYRAASVDADPMFGEEILDAAAALDAAGLGAVEVFGYLAGPERADERLTFRGVQVDVSNAVVDAHSTVIKELSARFRAAGLEVAVEGIGHDRQRLVAYEPLRGERR